ncbi:MAG: HNH endonuclease [Deltaproteobacteria bacterium]|nr:HNH endonuclease [Deltaproteobacteria bacterium]
MPIDRWGKYSLLTGNEGPGRCFCCGKERPNNRRYCCDTCRDLYYLCFLWPVASWACLYSSGICADCKEAPALLVHHIIPLDGSPRHWNRLNRPDNLVALCRSCHQKRHNGLAKPKPKQLGGLVRPGLQPLCGWEWIEGHLARFPDGLPEQSLEVWRDGELVGSISGIPKRGVIKTLVLGQKIVT